MNYTPIDISYRRGSLLRALSIAAGVTAAAVLSYSLLAARVTQVGTFEVPQITLFTTSASHFASSGGWLYKFSDYPDGALPKQDWNFEVGTAVADYNNEQQAYTRRTENVRIENGVLVIEAKPEANSGKNYTSARINTKGKFAFEYGTLEADMMLPSGAGTWPAAWLMPSNNAYNPGDYGIAKNDKYSWALNGEIDFAEAIGNLPGQNIPTIHSYNEIHSRPTYTPAFVNNQYGEYHKYGIIKTPDKITFTLDGKPYATREKTGDSALDWPFNQPYYLILNLAIGGNWAGDKGIDDSAAPWQLKVRSLSYSPL